MNEMEKKSYVLTFGSLVGLVVAEESGRVGGDGRKRRKRACGCGWENEMVIDCSYYMWTGKAWGVRRTHVAATHFFISTSGCEWNKPNLELHPRKRLSTLVNKLILNLSLNSIIKQALLKHNNLFLNKLINMRLGLSMYMCVYIYIYIWEMLRVQHFYNIFFF